MRNILGDFIEKRSWLLVLIIVLITIGFASVLPSLQFKTDFNQFAPENDLVKANNRIGEYFGSSQDIVFLIVTKQQTNSSISPQALRDQYTLQQNLLTIPKVNGTISFTTFLDMVCQLEFNETLENCTDAQLLEATHDLLVPPPSREQQLFGTNMTYSGMHQTANVQSEDPSAQITNCFLIRNQTIYTFSIQVASLSNLSSSLKPTIKRTHLMEWYIGFENLLAPPEYNIQYQLAARIEPVSPLWVIGNGVINNLREFLQHGRNHTLFNAYKTSVYLWLQIPGQTFSIPINLPEAQVLVNTSANRIDITVPVQTLSDYGIAPRYGSIEIPSKLSNFTAGVRYYQTPILHRPGGRIEINTSYLFDRLQRLQKRPLLSAVANRFLQKNGVSLKDLQNLSSMTTTTTMLPSTIGLSDLETLWATTNQVPSVGVSSIVYPVFPTLFNELRVNALSFISKDYEQTGQPTKSIILLQVLSTNSSEETTVIDNIITSHIAELSSSLPTISVQITGQGVITAQINEVTLNANQLIIPLIVIIIMIILFISYRRPSYVFLSILVFLCAAVWLLGTMAILNIPFTIIEVAVIPLLIGLGVEYSVVFFYNYRHELEKGKTSAVALKQSISDVGTAISLAWFTMFSAFLSFLSATIPPVRDFGFLLALGISYSFILTMTLTVSLRYTLDKNKPRIEQHMIKTASLKKTMERISHHIERHEKLLFLAVIIISVLMLVGASRLQSGFNTDEFIPQNNEALKLLNNVMVDFPFSSQEQEDILIEGHVATVDALQGIAQTLQHLKNNSYIAINSDGSVKQDSIYTYIQQALRGNSSLASVYHVTNSTGIPATNTDVQGLYDYLYTNDQFSQEVKTVLYKGPNGYTATVIRVYINSSSQTTSDEQQYSNLKNELNADLVNYGNASAIVTGNFLITLTIINSLTESQIISTGVAFMLAAIILILIYRSPILGLITMIPVSISILWILGTMYYIGYTLNVLTITVTSITIGVGVDYGVYITQRFRLVARKTGDPDKALHEAITLTGSSVMIVALSSLTGFAVLLFAPIPPQQQFGLITAITLAYSFLISISILPLVLVRWGAWRKKRKGYIVRPPKEKKPPETNS